MSNIEEGRKEIIERYTPDISSSVSHTLENIYNAAWHNGRKAEREKLSKCGYLIIDPEKMDKVAQICGNPPCTNCKCKTKDRLTGCLANPQTCEEYQEYSLVLELIKYFNFNYEPKA